MQQPPPKPAGPRVIAENHPPQRPARDDIVAGLAAEQASVEPKYFYDALGSRLFEAITALPEYYPTRTELALLAAHAAPIARAAGPAPTLIDLGAGNCLKAASLFAALRPAQYVAIDISESFLAGALAALQREHPQQDMLGIATDFSEGVRLPDGVRRDNRLFFYPGSSIGNFTPLQASAFLTKLRTQCAGSGGLLIGVDLVKPRSVLEAAYDDPLGVTAAFNLNMLNHLNALAETDFNVADWRHVAFFNATLSRIEMHLEARQDVTVHWPGGARRFAQGERIHTENSYKYRREDFAALLRAAGFRDCVDWTDDNGWFALFYAAA